MRCACEHAKTNLIRAELAIFLGIKNYKHIGNITTESEEGKNYWDGYYRRDHTVKDISPLAFKLARDHLGKFNLHPQRIPITSVLGHSMMVACITYFLSREMKARK